MCRVETWTRRLDASTARRLDCSTVSAGTTKDLAHVIAGHRWRLAVEVAGADAVGRRLEERRRLLDADRHRVRATLVERAVRVSRWLQIGGGPAERAFALPRLVG